MITCLRSFILLFSFIVQAKRLKYIVENKVKTFLSTCAQVGCCPIEPDLHFIMVMYVSAIESDIVTDSQGLVEEGLLLIHEEIHGKMEERQIERKAAAPESI